MTYDIDPWYGITVSNGEKIGPKQWYAKAYIFRRDTQEQIGEEFIGEGGARTTAADAALEAAKPTLYGLGEPSDWSGPEGGFTIYGS